MMWRSVGLAFLLPTFGFSQDPPQPDRDALYKELLEKVGASGPFTAKLAFESVDEKGVASIRYKASIHMRMKEGWIYLEFHEVGKEEQTGCSVFDGNRFIQVWAKDGVSGVRSDVRSTYQALLKHQWRMEAERRNVLEDSDPPKDFAAYAKGLLFYLVLQLEPSPPGSPEPAAFKFAMGATDKGGFSWLNAVRGAGKIVATADDVTVSETSPARTTVIDRRTGFLRSLRLDLPSGVGKIVKTVEVAFKAKHPEVLFPDQWIDRPWRTAETVKLVAHLMKSESSLNLVEILKQWPQAGRKDRVEALRNYIAWIAAEFDAMNRETSRVDWAAFFVKKAVERGASLDDLSRDLDAQAKRLGESTLVLEGSSKQLESWEELLANFRRELEKAVADAPGSDDDRKVLTSRIQEGFQPERIKKAVSSLGAPDYARILREAIDAAREQRAR